MSPRKEKSPLSHRSSSHESFPEPPPPKRSKFTNRIRVHVVHAKLAPNELAKLFALIEGRKHCASFALESCLDAKDADVIVTAVRMRQRLERHLDWEIAKSKALVVPEWLFESSRQGKPMPCGDYAAVEQMHDETAQNGLDDAETSSRPSSAFQLEPLRERSPREHDLSYKAKLSCCRASPLVCPNQKLVEELDIIKRSRWLDGEDINALSYSRAIATIKAFPQQINEHLVRDEVCHLPYIGPKTITLIKEFLRNGHIAQSQSISTSARFQSLTLFTSIYGIGPSTARDLYASGMRTIEHLEEYFWSEEDIIAPLREGETRHPLGVVDGQQMDIHVALKLRADLAEKIPRDEVEEMRGVVMDELGHIRQGCVSTIVGGYRRGKTLSNDVDIVITHPGLKSGGDAVKGLCAKLVQQLVAKGLITHVMHLSSFHAPGTLRTTQWDSLEKALTVFILPPAPDRSRRVHRRLDLIVVAAEMYWTAIVGWTGSTMFERDLRRWAKDRGMKFHSAGVFRRRDSKAYYPRSEQEVFDVLGLQWVHPTLRNADA